MHDNQALCSLIIFFSAKSQIGEAITSTEILVQSTTNIVEESIYTEIREEIFELPCITTLTDADILLKEGSNLHIETKIDPFNDSSMEVNWYHNKDLIQTGHRVTTIHSFGYAILEIIDITIEDCGTYTCVATNQKGFSEQTYTVNLLPKEASTKPQFTHPFKPTLKVTEGESIHMETGLLPLDDPTMTVEWFHNGQPLRQSSRIKTTSDFGYVIFDISRAETLDSGEYTVIATNQCGSDTNKFCIECVQTQNISQHPIQNESLVSIQKLEQKQKFAPASEKEAIAMSPKFQQTLIDRIDLIEGQSVHIETQLLPINDQTMKVEWFRDGKPLIASERFRTINEFGFVILDITCCYEYDSGVYEIVAKNNYGSDSLRTTIVCRGIY